MSKEPDTAWKVGLNTERTGSLANSDFTCSKEWGQGQGRAISMNSIDKEGRRGK